MFRFNGFDITIMKDCVLATQGMARFTFPNLEAAMSALGQ
jgi:hypothetical protein